MNNKVSDEHSIIFGLASGDRDTFAYVYNMYAGLLYKYAYNRIGIKGDSEELVQEVFVWIWTKRESLSNVSSLKPYLFGMLKNRIIGYIRHSIVRKKYAESYARFLLNISNDVEEFADVSDIQLVIEQSIKQLPERCEAAFRMSRMENLSIQHIAQQMKISTRTVENYITQALKHLRMSIKNSE